MTPGSLRAALTSTEVIRACAYGLRRKAMCSIPGSVMLSVQLVWPVMRRSSSLRRRALPNSPACAWVPRSARSFAHSRLGGAPYGAHDVLIAGTAAQVAFKTLADLLVAGVRILSEQVGRRHDHPRRAVSALQRVLLVESALERVQATVRQ